MRRPEHHSREELKRIVIGAIVTHSKTGHMAQAAGVAADNIIDLMAPTSKRPPLNLFDESHG